MRAIIGQVIGNHRVTEKIADGVTGAVYKAEHTVIGRHVAIKFLRAEYSADPELVNRFFTVLRKVSAIEHPSIIQIFDFGYHAYTAYIVMEFLDFETLEQRIQRDGRMRMAFTLDIVSQVTDALRAVHEKGILHEDLKADNIALVPDPAVTGGKRAKLLDFGLATLLTDAGTGARKVRNEAELPVYTAPEQLVGPDDVDQRADLYALGCIFYEMLCGRPPFTSRDLFELVDQLLSSEPPRARALVASIPPEVDAVVMRLLAKDKSLRYQTARALSAAIDELQGDFMSDISSIGVRPTLGNIRFATYRPEIDGPATDAAPDASAQVNAAPFQQPGQPGDMVHATSITPRADRNLALFVGAALVLVALLVAVALLFGTS